MNVKQASRLKAGEVIGEIIARVVKIEPPKRQSEAQAKAGVHNQSIFLQDPDGTEIRMVLMKPSIHLPLTEAGARFHFRSLPDDRGRLSGIITKTWRRNDGTEDFYLEANDSCRSYQIKDERTKGTTAGAPASLPPGQLNMNNVVEFYCDIVASMEARLNGSALWDALVRDPAPLMSSASSVFIECNKRGIMERHVVHAPVTPQYDPAPETEQEEYERSDEPENGEPSGKFNEPFEDLLARDAINDRSVSDMRDRPDVSWEKVYDKLFDHLRGIGYEVAAIEAAYDLLRRTMTRNGSEKRKDGEIEYHIADDFHMFKESVRKAQQLLNEHRPPPKQDHPQADTDSGDGEEDAFDPSEVFSEPPA